MDSQLLDTSLQGCTVAIPETRQLDILAGLLERRSATVIRCPLVSILDAPDPQPVLEWIKAFINQPPDDFILLTGEGLRRLLSCADRYQLKAEFILALANVRTICRGPKPGRALKEINLSSTLIGVQPTTMGIIETLEGLDLKDRKMAVQLYGTDPNLPLMDYLHSRGIQFSTVAPYVYAPAADSQQVVALINKLKRREIDFIAFTSQPQITRLRDIAKAHQLESDLIQGMAHTKIAAVGPVVAEMLKSQGFKVDIMPAESYFMKPLVNCIVQSYAGAIS